MIEYALLIMLGFCIGGLIAFLLAPTIWHRAVRLTTKRLESTMPMSLSEIEADKDLLRASYAIRLRRLESALNQARDKSANQLVDISKLQMQIAELNSRIAALNTQLEERKNAANVFESTIRKRFPELENKAAMALAALDDRALEIADLNNKLLRREETLATVQRSANLQQDEIRKLREMLERSGSDLAGRSKRGPSLWTSDDYRSENDRLNLEMSKMREQLVLAQERENQQIALLKREMQQLAERMMSSAVATDRHAAGSYHAVRQEQPKADERAGSRPVSPSTSAAASFSGARPQPWPGIRPAKPVSSASDSAKVLNDDRAQSKKLSKQEIDPNSLGEKPEPAKPARAALLDRSLTAAENSNPDSASNDGSGGQERQEQRHALRSLLNRSVNQSVTEQQDNSAAEPSETEISGQEDDLVAENSAELSATSGPEAEKAETARAEPKLDKVFREILDGRSSEVVDPSSATASQADEETQNKDGATAQKAGDESAEGSEPASPSTSDAGTTQTLLERLRHTRERQTG